MSTKTSKASVLTKIALLILIMSMLFVLFAVTASAADYSIVGNIDAPVGGMTPDYECTFWGTNAEKMERVSVMWIDLTNGGERLQPNDGKKFVTGHVYAFAFTMDGKGYFADTVTCSIDDHTATVQTVTGHSTWRTFSYTFPAAPAPMTTVHVTGLTEPKWGNKPDFSVNVTETNQELAALEWYDESANERIFETDNTEFLAGHTYRLRLYLLPKGDNRYSDSTVTCYLTHSGGPVRGTMKPDGGYYDPDDIGRYVDFEFMMGGTQITSVDIIGLAIPEGFSTPDTSFSFGDTPVTKGVIQWYDITDSYNGYKISASKKFEYGHKYRVFIGLTPNKGYYYKTNGDDVMEGSYSYPNAIKINGKDLSYYSLRLAPYVYDYSDDDWGGMLILQLEFSVDNEIKNVDLTVPQPAVGAKPATASEVTGKQATYTVKNVSWSPADSTFISGKSYTVTATLKANKGYMFPQTTAYTVNTKTPVFLVSGVGTEEVTVSYIFTAVTAKTISSVTITGVETPVTGKGVKTTAEVSTDGVTIDHLEWYEPHFYFKADIAYEVTVYVKASTGYVFASSVSATINGKAATFSKSGDTGMYCAVYTFPKTFVANGVKPTITTQPKGGNYIIDDSVKLTVAAKSNDGGTLSYQWYRTTLNDISTILAIYDEDDESYGTQSTFTPPQDEGTVYYCVMVTDEVKENGIVAKKEFIYSNLVAVTFNEKPATLSGIEIQSKPTKLTYNKGEALNTAGMKIRAVMSDGYKDITSGFTCSPTTLNTVGTQKITVTYQGKTASFDVTVAEGGDTINVTSIEMFNLPHKTTYKVGEAFDPEGLIIKIFLAEGGWLQGNNFKDMTFSPTTLNTVGTQKITVTYQGKTTSFNVTVTGAEHTHIFSAIYKFDNTQHWNECSCGEKSAAVAHKFGEWEAVKAATETAEGSKERACSVCGYKETEVIPAIGAVTTPLETSAPGTSAPETSAPETSAPETSAPDTSAADTSKPDTADTTKPTDPEKPAGYIPWWIILIISVAFVGIATVVVIVVLKKNKK